MQVRHIVREEAMESARISSIAFVYPLKEEDREEIEKNYGRVIAAFNDAQEMIASMAVIPFRMWMDGRDVGMSGIGDVVSLPESRDQGNIRRVFDAAFAEMRARGDVWSVLYPFSHAYYRKMGYALCNTKDVYEFETKEMRKLPSTARWEMVNAGDAACAEVQALYEAFAREYNMMLKRDEALWEKYWKESDAKKLCYTYLQRDTAGRPTAYLRIRAEGAGDARKAVISEIVWQDSTALKQCFSFLGRFSAAYAKIELHMSQSADVLGLFAEPYGVKKTFQTSGMARIIDVARALEGLRLPAESGEVKLQIQDEQLEENRGGWQLRWGNGEISVQRVELEADKADLCCGIGTLSQLVCGYISLEAAKLCDDVTVGGNQRALSALFMPKPRALYNYF